MSARDTEAFDLASRRSYRGAFVVSLEIEMQTRRLTLELYGALHGGSDTYLGTLTFFGAAELRVANEDGNFPHSVHLSALELEYDDAAATGSATLRGARDWTAEWSFDGLSYEERAATIASLTDDDPEPLEAAL